MSAQPPELLSTTATTRPSRPLDPNGSRSGVANAPPCGLEGSGSRCRRQVRPERVEAWSQARELLEVSCGEPFHAPRTLGGQFQPDDPLIGDVCDALDQSAVDRSVDELDHAVMAQQEVVSGFADRRCPAVASDGEEQLVLGGSEAGRLRLLPAPPLEAPQAIAEVEEPAVVVIGQRRRDIHIVSR